MRSKKKLHHLFVRFMGLSSRSFDLGLTGRTLYIIFACVVGVKGSPNEGLTCDH